MTFFATVQAQTPIRSSWAAILSWLSPKAREKPPWSTFSASKRTKETPPSASWGTHGEKRRPFHKIHSVRGWGSWGLQPAAHRHGAGPAPPLRAASALAGSRGGVSGADLFQPLVTGSVAMPSPQEELRVSIPGSRRRITLGKKVGVRGLICQCPRSKGPRSCGYPPEGQWCSYLTGWVL